MSSAQSAASAASAAFKGTHSQPNSKRTTRPNLRLSIDSAANGSRASLAAAQTSQQRSQAKVTTPGARPARSPIGPLGIDRNGQGKPRAKRASTTSDDDVLLLALTSSDYFSNYKAYGQANAPEVVLPAPQRLRTSINTNPQNMLEQVRQSINSKSKVGVAKEAARKLQAALDEFRQSVDLRRMKSQLKLDVALVYEDLELDTPYIYKQPQLANTSHSSIGSVSDGDVPVTPIIKLIRTASIENDLPNRNHHQSSLSPVGVSSSSVSVAQIPVSLPSANAVARSSVVSLDPFGSAQLLPSHNMTNRPDAPEESKSKARRKPPPGIYTDDEHSLSGHSLIVPTSDTEEAEEGTKLPVFPDIREKTKKHKLLFRRKKPKEETAQYEEFLDDDSDRSGEFVPSRSATPVVTLPQVKFKTTMRKVNKRREKKTAFNEDKPWKNHSELDYVSEQQRKRYEGLWVSNKGLYMNKVRTRLVGVNYDKEDSQQYEKKQMSEKEISEFAAKLSSKTASGVDATEQDIQQLHGLVDADAHELIHGVVVKRIWSRSKLSQEVLASIWELVDFRKDGTLNKAEFIVGMWLVDQCLYGRKLPKEVGELVWASLGSIGVRVVIKKKRR